MIRTVLLTSLSLAACLLAPREASAQRATVSLSASRTRVTVGEQFVLEARVDVEDGEFEQMEVPDLGDFQVLGERESRPYSFSFSFGHGSTSRSSVVRTYSLRPLAAGTVRLGPVKAVVDGKTFRSEPLTIEVAQGSQPSAPGGASSPAPPSPDPGSAQGIDPSQVDPTLFLRAVADTTEARVGQQVTVSIYLYTRARMRGAPAVTQEPSAEGFWTHDLLPVSRQLSATMQEVNGRRYRAYLLRRFAAFPLTAGTQRIGPMTVEVGGGGSIFDLFNGPSKPLTRTSQPLDIEVAPLPDSVDPQAPWHVGTLEVEWSATPERVSVGDAVTLRAKLEGSGNLRAVRLPDPVVPGFEVLDPTVTDQVTADAAIVGGTRTYEWLALARQAGDHTAASPEVQVVEPSSGEVSTAKAAAITLHVEPAAGTAHAGAASPDDASPDAEQASGGGLDLGPPRTQAQLDARSTPLFRRPWYVPSLLALPLLACVLFILGAMKRARAARLSARADLQLTRAAEQALEQAKRGSTDPADRLRLVRRALLLGVERAVGENAEAWTYDELERRVAQSGASGESLATELAALLREIEAARFMPGSQDAASDAVHRAEPLLGRLRVLSGGGAS